MTYSTVPPWLHRLGAATHWRGNGRTRPGISSGRLGSGIVQGGIAEPFQQTGSSLSDLSRRMSSSRHFICQNHSTKNRGSQMFFLGGRTTLDPQIKWSPSGGKSPVQTGKLGSITPGFRKVVNGNIILTIMFTCVTNVTIYFVEGRGILVYFAYKFT